jgi:N-methylhydantoinase A/oxoprolinase/acetone carboxylase beta subunit
MSRAELQAQGQTAGPLAIEDRETTILVDPNGRASVDAFGHVFVELD